MSILAGCETEPPALRVGPVGYTEEDLGALGPAQTETLADLTAFGLAVAGGLADAVVQPMVDRELRSLVLQRLALELGADRQGLDEQELMAAYARQPEHELQVRHLVVLSERWRPQEHRDSARARASEALARYRAGEPFPELAAEYSDEPDAAERGGLLQPGREGSWVPEFWRAASSLGEGEVSDVVETEFGFHVIRLEDRSVVPFEEVRDRVVERMVDLPNAMGRATEWAEERARGAEVDTAAIANWRSRPEDQALVRWPGESVPAFTVGDLEQYVRTLSPDAAAALTSEAAAPVGAVRSAARSHLMLHEAAALGLIPTPSQRTAIRQRWLEQVGGWAEALGFAPGQSQAEVRVEALEAVGTQHQEAMVARQEVQRLSPVLRSLYPVERPAEEPGT